MTIVAIHQPNFLPWLGYFHKLINCDVFIFLDDAQFPRGKSYTSRVLIKSPSGPMWLTVPVRGKGDMSPIKDVFTADNIDWQRKHLRTLEACYARTPYFKDYIPLIEQIYQMNCSNLADFNINLITALAGCFSAQTRMVRSSELAMDRNGSLEHLIRLVKYVGGTEYLTGTGKGSLRYIDEEAFDREGVKVLYQNFNHPQYPQQWGEFVSNLSAIDLLFNWGPDWKRIITNA
jgi:hypothetical protein